MVDSKPAKTKIRVSICMGTNCTFRGAAQLVESLLTDEEISRHCEVIETSCLNDTCDHAKNSPVIRIEDDYVTNAKPEVVLGDLHALILARRAKQREP